MKRRSSTPPVALAISPDDLVLAAAGPWDSRSGVPSEKPLCDERCTAERLRTLWARHEPEIRAAAAPREPWVLDRLFFVDELHR